MPQCDASGRMGLRREGGSEVYGLEAGACMTS